MINRRLCKEPAITYASAKDHGKVSTIGRPLNDKVAVNALLDDQLRVGLDGLVPVDLHVLGEQNSVLFTAIRQPPLQVFLLFPIP